MVVPSKVVPYDYIVDGLDNVLYFDSCHHHLLFLP